MDTLSQALLGSAVAVAATRGQSPVRAILYGAGIGTLPDLDVLLPFADDLQAMIQHRTWTHSWLVHLLIGPLLGLLLHATDRTWPLRTWFLMVMLVLLTHPALDSMTIYGTWLFWPFMSQPLMGGSIFIIDPLYTLPLLIAVVVAWRSASRARATRATLVGIALSSGYLVWGVLAQAHVERLAWQSLENNGLEASQLIATPTPFNSILWRVIAIDDDNYHEGYHHLLFDDTSLNFHSYPRYPELSQLIDPETGYADLINFNHGYFKLAGSSEQVIASDLRMGVEPFFFFKFVMADSKRPEAVPRGAPIHIEPVRMFSWLGRRLLGQQLEPLPDYRSDAAELVE